MLLGWLALGNWVCICWTFELKYLSYELHPSGAYIVRDFGPNVHEYITSNTLLKLLRNGHGTIQDVPMHLGITLAPLHSQSWYQLLHCQLMYGVNRRL